MISHAELLGRLLPAALRGSVIGFERERLNWAAGLRTHMLGAANDVSIALSRATTPEFAAICRQLENLAGVRECRPDIPPRSLA